MTVYFLITQHLAKFQNLWNFYRMRGSRGGQGARTPPPPDNHKNIGFLSNTCKDPMEHSNQANTHCWGTIGPPAKRHLAFRWRADDGPLLVYFDPLAGACLNGSFGTA